MFKYNPPCPFRLSARECVASSEGKCCCECDEYESCEAACKNTPEKCGRIERMLKYNPPCPFRLSTRECAASSEGKCCCECDEYESCEAACKNTPEKCGRIERWQKEEG